MNTWLEDFQDKTDLNKYPVALRTKGGIGYRLPSGEIVSNFVGHPVHYFDNGLWKPITLEPHSNGDFEGSDFSWRGKQVFYRGKTLFKPRAVSLDGVKYKLFLRQDGNRVVADLPFGQYEVIFSEKGVRELLTIPQPIEGLIEFDIPHANKPRGLYKQDRHIVGGITAESFQLTKDMTYPLVIDPNYVTSTADGSVKGISTSYATARSTATNFNTSSSVLEVGGSGISGTYVVSRVFLKFDTSGIPDSDVISAVTMTLHTNIVSAYTYDFDVLINKLDWSAYDPISSGNMDSAYDANLSASLDDNIWGNTAGKTNNAFYTSGALSTSHPSKTGNTYYGLISSRDRNNLAWGNYQEIQFHSGDELTYPAYRPYLTVTHAAAASSVPMPVIMY